jgi:hypothetical protein
VAEVPKRLGPSRPPYFASGGDEECAFCFDVTQDRGDGEYPVYFYAEPSAGHHELCSAVDVAIVLDQYPKGR